MSVTVKLFMQDDCQALDLPDEFRFAGEEVKISKISDMVILEQIEMPRPPDIEAVSKKPDSPNGPSAEQDPRIVRNE
jgi:virulence-associated protein VagC